MRSPTRDGRAQELFGYLRLNDPDDVIMGTFMRINGWRISPPIGMLLSQAIQAILRHEYGE